MVMTADTWAWRERWMLDAGGLAQATDLELRVRQVSWKSMHYKSGGGCGEGLDLNLNPGAGDGALPERDGTDRSKDYKARREAGETASKGGGARDGEDKRSNILVREPWLHHKLR